MNAKYKRTRVWKGQERFVPPCALIAVILATGCTSEEKTIPNVDPNGGLVAAPTSTPCQGTAWSDDVCIPGSEFVMGRVAIPYTPPPCPPGDVCGPGNPPPTDYAPPHIVKLSPYFMDRYPATNAEYKACYDAQSDT